MAEIDNKWNEIAPFLLDYYYTVAPERRNEVSQKIRKFYYGDQQISVQNYKPLVQVSFIYFTVISFFLLIYYTYVRD